MKKLFSVMLSVMLATTLALAQVNVRGIVVSASDGEPLAGATVMPVGGGQGVATDLDGRFQLSVPSTVKKITVSYVGMTSKTVAITSGEMKIELEEGATNLDEVMVVAYGTAKKSAYTGSASVVKADKIENALVTDAVNALKGVVSGVQILSNNGQPGTSPTVRIRGVGSINAGTSPLYVVDGVPFDGDIASLNTMDISSMTVLKDAASAALYGARGANGVILITTKQGQEGKAKITLDARWGGNSREIKNYNVIKDPAQYYELAYTALNNGLLGTGYNANTANRLANQQMIEYLGYQVFTAPAGQSLVGLNGKLNPNATLGYSNGKNYFTPDNWEDLTFNNGLRQEYNLSISGGNDRFNYYLSAAYLGDEGVIQGSNYKRLATRAAVDYQAKSWLKLGTNLAYSYVNMGYPSGQTSTGLSTNAFSVVNRMAPVYPFYVRNADGSFMTDAATGDPIYDFGDGRYTGGVARKGYMPGSNPAAILKYDMSETLMDVLNAKWYAQLTPVKGLTITGTIGYNLDNTRDHEVMNKQYGTYASAGGAAYQYQTRTSGLNLQAIANYRHSFGANSFDYMVGYESYEYYREQVYATGRNLYNPNSWAINNTLEDVNRKGYGSRSQYATRGIFGRVNYDYDTRYFASVSYRRDASSRFAPDKRWGNFWSVSAAWDIAKENFMADSREWLDMLKFKASFGQQGNDNIGNNYAYLDQYELLGTDSWQDGNLSYKGNPDLTWETSNAFNTGFDFSFFQGRIDGTIEYFQRQTSDMLYNRPVAPSNGYSSIPMNVGSMRNNGIEIELRLRPVVMKNFTWDVNFNGTWIKNKVLKLHPDLNGEMISGLRIYKEGDSMYQYYMVQYAGVNPENGNPMFWAKDEDGNEYKTENFDTARSNNRKLSGNFLPTFYGGFGTSIQAYGFDFSIQFGYQLGGRVYDSGYLGLLHRGKSSSLGTNWHADILKAWTPENPDTNIPSLNSMGTYSLADNSTDFGLISSNYLSLNNISVGYTIPVKLTRKLGLEKVHVYGAADNVALWSKRKGLDPRTSYTSVSTGTYSALRCISGGIRVEF